ncbi:MAG TPA: hypothetical protein VEB19_12685 [Gemmatimonadaceae bacterium]|nr:hypothetical protein [Gemmatimonadaceae bacterium]
MLVLVCLSGTHAAAQAPGSCPTQIYFEFQVDAPASFRGDSSLHVVPVESRELSPPNLVQFTVDTTGLADSLSFKVLRASDRELIAGARAALRHWRFSPARVGSCAVRQLYQTPIAPGRRRSAI